MKGYAGRRRRERRKILDGIGCPLGAAGGPTLDGSYGTYTSNLRSKITKSRVKRRLKKRSRRWTTEDTPS